MAFIQSIARTAFKKNAGIIGSRIMVLPIKQNHVAGAGAAVTVTAGSTVMTTTTSKRMMMSDSITYSGGQASTGQGGFYGSGGARAEGSDKDVSDARSELVALAGDVKNITNIMDEVSRLESLLDDADERTTSKSIEIKSNIKKLMTSSDFIESLNRLEIKGEPIWGLSSDERDLITEARNKLNLC